MELELDPEGKVDLAQDPKGKVSLPVSRLSSGNRMEDREMQKRVESRRYPTIDGVLHRHGACGANSTYKVSGDVTFRGVNGLTRTR